MTLALIAGNGALPAAIVAALDVRPLVCVFDGCAPDGLQPDLTFRLETLGSLLQALSEQSVTEVCFAGALARPQLDPSKLDALTAPLVPMMLAALQKGDDGALRVILDLFETRGFALRAAHDLAPDLLIRDGILTVAQPDAQMRADADVGAAHIALMGPRDIGQACVVAGGEVRGMEDSTGTDALMSREAAALAGTRAILFKGPKPDQSRLVDLPTIGPDTVRNAINAGLVGIVVDAGEVLMLEPQKCCAIADAAGLVIWARTSA